jgi:hypothetical protein
MNNTEILNEETEEMENPVFALMKHAANVLTPEQAMNGFVLDLSNGDILPLPKKRGRPKNDDAKYKQNDYKDYQKQYRKQYYEKNKDKMLGSMKEKVACDHCGKIVSKTNLVPHKRTKACQNHEDDE